MAEGQVATILDLDSMMDGTMDNVPDMPDFVTPPAGTYFIKVEDAKTEKYTAKDKTEGSRLRITYAIKESLQLANDKDSPVANGSLFSESFMGTKQGLGFFKRRAKKLLNVASLEGVTMREILDELKQVECKAVITIRTSTSNGVEYENVNIRPVFDEEVAA